MLFLLEFYVLITIFPFCHVLLIFVALKFYNSVSSKTSVILDCILDIPHAPAGDKYLVARRWGHIRIVTRKWVDQSVVKRGILAVLQLCLIFVPSPVRGVCLCVCVCIHKYAYAQYLSVIFCQHLLLLPFLWVFLMPLLRVMCVHAWC